jgi:hypothetical protein
MDILGTLVRQDRVKALIEKKKVEWTAEEKAKESGGPIKFGNEEDKEDKDFEDFLDLIMSSDNEDDEEDGYEEDDSLPTIDFTYKPPTLEEKVQQRLDSYASTLYHMKEFPFVQLCIKEGVLSENHIY